jgi:hypothetical protein
MATRNYSMPDSAMMEFSRIYRQLFLDNQADFTAFDGDFDATYAANWLAAVEASEVTDSDETRDDILTGETADVGVAMAAARKLYARAKCFINKAFKQQPAVKDEFGLDDYQSIGASMARFLAVLHNKAENKYKAELLAAGATQAQLDEMLTVKNTLSAEKTEQGAFKATGPEDTTARIAAHNATWVFTQNVNEASKGLYYEDTVKLNLFLLPRNEEPDADLFNVIGTVRDAASASPLANVTIIVSGTGISTTTDANGQYGLAGIAPGNNILTFSLADYVTETATAVVPDDGSQNVVDVQLAAEV